MPRGGSNKLPTAILEFRGTARKDRTNPNEPHSEKLTSKPPDWLDATARKTWFQLVKVLHWLTESDAHVLAYYCQSHSRYRVLTLTLAELQSAEEPNLDAINAQMIRLEKAELSVRALAAELGMNPVSRTRINAKPQNTGDSFDEWERRREA